MTIKLATATATATAGPSDGEHWMVQAAAEAAPPLSADTIDSLRRILAPTRSAPTRSRSVQRKQAA